MSEKKMNYREAFSWLNQTGVKATLFNRDRHTNEALKKAIEALKKQVPMSYKMVHAPERTFKNGENGEIVNVFTYHCPCCNQELGDSDWDGKPDKEWLEYCDNCGQRIDWIHDVEIPKFEEVTDCRRVKVGAIN